MMPPPGRWWWRRPARRTRSWRGSTASSTPSRQTADIRQKLVGFGLNPIGKGTPAELDRFLQAEIIRWGKVVQQAGVAGSE